VGKCSKAFKCSVTRNFQYFLRTGQSPLVFCNARKFFALSLFFAFSLFFRVFDFIKFFQVFRLLNKNNGSN
jgi:hypothetical protein